MPIDLSDAIFQAMRANIQLTQAFGDTWNSSLSIEQNVAAGNVCKFWGGYADQVDLPLLVELEPGETYQNLTQGPKGVQPYYAEGQLQIIVVHTGRYLARQLGELVIFALENQPIAWPGVKPMLFQVMRGGFNPVTGIGPFTPTVAQRVLTFQYDYSGTRTAPIPGEFQ